MFCPKCAAKNEDDTKFCRGCGQDISLALRGLKGHSAVVVAGKVDQLFDRHNEGLLWTGVLGVLLFIASAVLIVIELYQGQAASYPLLFFMQCIWMMMGLAGMLNFVAYRRSLQPLATKQSDANAGLFCPACGNKNTQHALACAACDQSFEGLSASQDREQKGWFYRFIDSSTNFSRRDVKYQKQGMFAFFGGFLFLLLSLPVVYLYSFPVLPSINLLFVSLFFFVAGFWRYVAERRVVLSPEEQLKALVLGRERSQLLLVLGVFEIVAAVFFALYTVVTSLVKPQDGPDLYDPVVGYLLSFGFLVIGVVLIVQGLSRRAELKRLSGLSSGVTGTEALTQRQSSTEGERVDKDASTTKQLPDPAHDEFITARLDESAK